MEIKLVVSFILLVILFFQAVYYIYNGQKIFGITILVTDVLMIITLILINNIFPQIQNINNILSEKQRQFINKFLFITVITVFTIINLLAIIYTIYLSQSAKSTEQMKKPQQQTITQQASSESSESKQEEESKESEEDKAKRLQQEEANKVLQQIQKAEADKARKKQKQKQQKKQKEPKELNVQSVGNIVIAKSNGIGLISYKVTLNVICELFVQNATKIKTHKIWSFWIKLLKEPNMFDYFLKSFFRFVASYNPNTIIRKDPNIDIIEAYYKTLHPNPRGGFGLFEPWIVSVYVANTFMWCTPKKSQPYKKNFYNIVRRNKIDSDTGEVSEYGKKSTLKEMQKIIDDYKTTSVLIYDHMKHIAQKLELLEEKPTIIDHKFLSIDEYQANWDEYFQNLAPNPNLGAEYLKKLYLPYFFR